MGNLLTTKIWDQIWDQKKETVQFEKSLLRCGEDRIRTDDLLTASH